MKKLIKSPDLIDLQDEEKEELRREIIQNIEAVFPFFYEKFEEGERNLRYYKGKQWTAEELRKHREQFRRAYVFNEIFNKIDHIIGTQTETRMEINVLAKNQEDEKLAELLNYVIKWIEKVNNFEFVETTTFTDSIIKGVGVTGIHWNQEDINFGYPEIKNYPQYQFFWDLNSVEIDLSDARWMARVQFLPAIKVKEIFPEINEENIESLNDHSLPIPYEFEFFERQLLYHKENEKFKLIPIIEYYDWELKPVYQVIDRIRDEQRDFDSREDAEDFYNGLVDGYIAGNVILLGDDGSPNVYILESQDRVYRQTIMVGNIIIESNEIATPFFPYEVCFSYFHQGDFWSLVNQFISPQDLINRAFSQLDYQLGTSVKGAITVVRSQLDKSFGLEELRREWSKTSPIIPVLDHRAIDQKMFGAIPPQLFEEVNFGLQRLMDYAGGHNLLGFTEKAGESGKAVQERAQQAGISRLIFFDKLKIWRKNLGMKIVWYIKNIMNIDQILQILGDKATDLFMYMNTKGNETLKEFQYDITVSESNLSETMNEKYFQQLANMFQQFPTAPEVVVPTLLQFSTIPDSVKKDILSKLEFYQQYTQMKEQQKHEQNIQEQAMDVVKRKMIRQKVEEQFNVPERLPSKPNKENEQNSG